MSYHEVSYRDANHCLRQKKFSICSRDNFIENNLQQVRRFSLCCVSLKSICSRTALDLHNYTSKKQIHVHVTFRLERNEASKKTENRKSIKNGLHLLSRRHNECLCLFGAKAKNANNRNCFCLIEQYSLKFLIAFAQFFGFYLLGIRALLFDNG